MEVRILTTKTCRHDNENEQLQGDDDGHVDAPADDDDDADEYEALSTILLVKQFESPEFAITLAVVEATLTD